MIDFPRLQKMPKNVGDLDWSFVAHGFLIKNWTSINFYPIDEEDSI